MGIVSVLVCTRDRPESLVRAIRSLLASFDVEFELVVVDQSDDLESARALAPFASDPRLRYVRSASRGAGAALNEGLRLARGEIVACCDDDCEAPPGWVAAMVRVLGEQPTAAIVFCNVTPSPHDKRAGYVPAYQRRRSRLVRSIVATCAGHGLSAGMALRRDVVVALRGFDEALGPGARFPAGDDWDIAFRVLRSGWHVYETADVSIIHHGFRTFAEGREHARRDWRGIGAVGAKMLRTGHFGAMMVPLWEFSAHALWPPFADLFRLRRPSGLARIIGFVQGLGQGLRTPVDRKTLLFMQADPELQPNALPLERGGYPRAGT
jgi:glycosyltransferase involved in cell wall biosynthesis